MRNVQGPHAHPDFNGIIMRRTYKQIIKPGGLLDETRKRYTPTGGRYNHNAAEWRWSSGAKIHLGSLQYDSDLKNYQGAAAEWLGLDELDQFSQEQTLYLWGRCRSKTGIAPRLRATMNPDNSSWVFTFLAWWINLETGYPIPERSGVIRHFQVIDGRFVWYDDEQYDDEGEKTTISATFIPATLADNKALMEADPSYRQRLMQLSQSDRDRFLFGNWLSSSITGMEWDREYFKDVQIPLEEYPTVHDTKLVNMFSVDASKGKSVKTGDYSAIVCLTQTLSPALKFVDCDMKRRSPGQIVEDIFAFTNQEHHTIRSGDLIGVESVQFQEIFVDLIANYAISHPDYALSQYLKAGGIIIPVVDMLQKEMRIRRLDGFIRRREFRFLDNVDTALGLSQLRNFDGIPGKGKHDDFPDALDQALQLPAQLKRYYEERRKRK